MCCGTGAIWWRRLPAQIVPDFRAVQQEVPRMLRALARRGRRGVGQGASKAKPAADEACIPTRWTEARQWMNATTSRCRRDDCARRARADGDAASAVSGPAGTAGSAASWNSARRCKRARGVRRVKKRASKSRTCACCACRRSSWKINIGSMWNFWPTFQPASRTPPRPMKSTAGRGTRSISCPRRSLNRRSWRLKSYRTGNLLNE